MMRKLMAVSLVLCCLITGSKTVLAASEPIDPLKPIPADSWIFKSTKEISELIWPPITNCYYEAALPNRYVAATVVVGVCCRLMDKTKPRIELTAAQVSNLKRLADEFQVETKELGMDVPAVRCYLRSLSPAKPVEFRAEDYQELVEMSPDHWAYEAMKTMYERGIFEGYPGDTANTIAPSTPSVPAPAVSAQPRVFQQISKSSWVYQAIADLGALNPFEEPSGPTNCKPLLVRYEVATLIARIYQRLADPSATRPEITAAQMSALNKLVDEFCDELGGLGVDVGALRRDLRSLPVTGQHELPRFDWVKITGDRGGPQ